MDEMEIVTLSTPSAPQAVSLAFIHKKIQALLRIYEKHSAQPDFPSEMRMGSPHTAAGTHRCILCMKLMLHTVYTALSAGIGVSEGNCLDQLDLN